MTQTFADIKALTDKLPTWYDEHGIPRYCEFTPDEVVSIYAQRAAFLEISCQCCSEKFMVAMHLDMLGAGTHKEWGDTPEAAALLHYGDPPAHGCTGDSMNCIDLRIVEYWVRLIEWAKFCQNDSMWERRKDLEITFSKFDI